MTDNRQGTLHSHLHVRVPRNYRFPGLEPRFIPGSTPLSHVEGANLRFKDPNLIRQHGSIVDENRQAYVDVKTTIRVLQFCC